MSSPIDPSPRVISRRPYIDWARGLAVVIMIQAHVLDAWTAAGGKSTFQFQLLRVLGGLAAPLFLWLAGMALVLAAERHALRTGDRALAWKRAVQRGLEIIVLAFAFRLQSYLFSLGASPLSIFRVDILNVMGLALAGAGLLWGLVSDRRQQVAAFAIAATGIAMVTPLVRTATWVSALPVFFQWYLRPFGEHTTFTAFPWTGFVFAGGAVGAVLAAVPEKREPSVHGVLTVVGAGLIGLGLYTASRPSIYAESSFWTSSPTFYAVRVGLMMTALAAMYGLSAAGGLETRPVRWISTLGRASLFVYWVHVELVYGWATAFLRGRLPLEGALIGWVGLVAAMYGLVLLRDRLVATWRTQDPRRLKAAPV